MTDKERMQLAQAVRDTRENMPAILESITLSARLAKAKYDALMKEGFTAEQALELCARI